MPVGGPGSITSTRAAAVHPAEPLDHASPADQVADHVVGIEIDTGLAGGRRHEEHRLGARGPFPADQPVPLQFRGRGRALADPPTALELGDGASGPGS